MDPEVFMKNQNGGGTFNRKAFSPMVINDNEISYSSGADQESEIKRKKSHKREPSDISGAMASPYREEDRSTTNIIGGNFEDNEKTMKAGL